MNDPGIDVIGDVHGHADALVRLLHIMRYGETAGDSSIRDAPWYSSVILTTGPLSDARRCELAEACAAPQIRLALSSRLLIFRTSSTTAR